MGISDIIAGFINEVLDSEEGCAELQRAELAQRFRCVPSQINYVISTRFSPEHGYIVESRRGGNGYIRIRRAEVDAKQIVMHTVNAVGSRLDVHTARAFLSNLLGVNAIDRDQARIMSAVLEENALRCLPVEQRDILRANLFKQMLLGAVCAE